MLKVTARDGPNGGGCVVDTVGGGLGRPGKGRRYGRVGAAMIAMEWLNVVSLLLLLQTK